MTTAAELLQLLLQLRQRLVVVVVPIKIGTNYYDNKSLEQLLQHN